MKNNNKLCRLNQVQSGMTLIEVLVAMFVLTVGVLALLAVQVRLVSSVREAESQTIVSQLTQNLIEGMMLNPTMEAKGGKSYRLYWGHRAANSNPGVFRPDMTKVELAEAQLEQFGYDLHQALPDSRVFYSVCRDSSGAEPTFSGSGLVDNCDNQASSDTVVKVLWLSDTEGKLDNSDVASDEDYVVYTHQARVGEEAP